MTATENTIRILELLHQNPEGITPLDGLAHIDISRSSLFVLLKELKTLGYLVQTRARGRYIAGPRLLAWHRSPISGPQEIITAFYQEVGQTPIDETFALANFHQHNLVVIAQVESTQHVRSTYNFSQPYSNDNSAAHAILTPIAPEFIQRQGYHLRTYADTVELALPICSNGTHPDAALLLSAPSFRHNKKSILMHLPALREIAAQISYRLGARAYAPFQTGRHPTPGPTIPLNKAEITSFLSGPWTARLACIRPDNSPHVVPVWHEWNDRVFYITAWEGSNWAEYVLANPRVSLTVDEPWAPMRRVSAMGHATLADQVPGGITALLNRLSQRYLGHDHNSKLPWQAFCIQPESVKGWRGLNN